MIRPLRIRTLLLRAVPSLIAIAALSGCETGATGGYDPALQDRAGHTLIVTDASEYQSGATVRMRLTNKTGRRVTYNLCRSRIERGNDDDWRPVQTSLGEACTAELRTLSPGQSVTYAFKLPTLRRGAYRIATDLDDPQGRARIVATSNTFALAGDGSD